MKNLRCVASLCLILVGAIYITNFTNANLLFTYAKTKQTKEKKKPKGVSADGAAKVWNGEGFVSTDDNSVAPVENEKVKSGVYGADAGTVDNYIKDGNLINKNNDYYFVLSDGTYAELTWVNFDIDNDGYYEYLYFGPNGVLKINGTTPDGYKVNEFGAWVDENGNVKKLQGNKVENNSTVTSNAENIRIDRKNNSDKIVADYWLEIANKVDMPKKSELSNLLRNNNYSELEIDEVLNSVNWIEEGIKYVVTKMSLNTESHFYSKMEMTLVLKGAGLTESEIDNIFLSCGVSDWDQYTIDYVQRVVDSSAGTKDYKLVERLVKCGVDRSAAEKALVKIFGRELNYDED